MTDEFPQQSKGHRGTPGPREGLLFLLAVAVLYLVVGIPLQLLLGEAGMFLSQLGLLLLPALAFVHLRRYDAAATLSLYRPTARGFLGGFLLMAGGLPIAWVLAWLQSFVMEVPVELLEAMSRLLTTDDPWRMLWLLVLVSLTPAFCEEFLFRGVILSSFRSRWAPSLAVLLSAVVFGIFHMAPFRFLPTMWLGILLAWVVVETRSIWVAVVLHFLNNGLILLLTLMPMTRDAASDLDQEPPWLLVPFALLVFIAGIAVLRRAGREVRRDLGSEAPGLETFRAEPSEE